MSAKAQDSLKVAVCQLTSIDDVESNLQHILEVLSEVENDPADLVCLPENALYLRLNEGEAIPAMALDHHVIRELSKWAGRAGSVVHVGSAPMNREGRLYNSSLVIRPDGTVEDVYQKIHLFDVDVEGHKPVRESDAYAYGARPTVWECKGWKIGSSICYDLRFAELYMEYARANVDVILIPAAFLVPTGRAHWEVLTRARAIESQAYVLAAAQGGTHESKTRGTRDTYGHSIIIDPWGLVMETLPDDFGEHRVLRAELSQSRIQAVRRQIPMGSHRRLGKATSS